MTAQDDRADNEHRDLDRHAINKDVWQAQLIEQGVAQLAQAMLIVSSRGEIVFTSKAAGQMLLSGNGLCIDNQHLVADSERDNLRLQSVIQTVIESEHGNQGAIAVYVHREQSPRPYQITISKIPNIDHERRHGSHALVLIKDLGLNQGFWLDRLKDEYKLAPREVECTMFLSEGKTAQDIAQVMGIGKETVRQYMKNIFKKMGVHKQHEVVSLALEYRRNR